MQQLVQGRNEGWNPCYLAGKSIELLEDIGAGSVGGLGDYVSYLSPLFFYPALCATKILGTFCPPKKKLMIMFYVQIR